jgi:hypothetical protein
MAIYVGRQEPVGGGVGRTDVDGAGSTTGLIVDGNGIGKGMTIGGSGLGFGASVDGGRGGGGSVFVVEATGRELDAVPVVVDPAGVGRGADGTGGADASGSSVEGSTDGDGTVELATREDDGGPVRGGPTRVLGAEGTEASVTEPAADVETGAPGVVVVDDTGTGTTVLGSLACVGTTSPPPHPATAMSASTSSRAGVSIPRAVTTDE